MQELSSPPDGGMLYTETNLHNLFPEPLNAVTSCFFLAIAIFWSFRLWGEGRQYLFLSICTALLYLGGIGGIIYHGLRRWNVFIMMDWLPIMLLCLMAGIYFLFKIAKWYYGGLLLVCYVVFQWFARVYIQQHGDVQLFININYAILASMVLFPVLGYLITTKFEHGRWVGFALLAFIFALTFRVADGWGWLSIGTHFLWHTFGAVAAFCMFQYLYLINKPFPAEQI
jgi:hypothetical protein